MSEHGDSTTVTGSPVVGNGGPRRGEVLGERYEVRAHLGHDLFTLDYEAFDQESESSVLLRVIQPALLPTATEAQTAARRLSRILGVGGKHLSALLDADHEGSVLFVVESLPKGTSLREVMQARLARGERIEPKELLPVVARLSAALAAIPPPWRHGDVRAERVRIEPESLLLQAPFLATVLPHDAVSAAIRQDARLARVFAPEVLTGSAGDAADRFGVACMAFEALTGRIPEPGAASASELGRIGEVLRTLLAPAPSARPPSVEPLLEALATRAELPLPAIEAGGYRQPRRLAIRGKSEKAMPAVQETEELPDSDTEPASTLTDRKQSRRPIRDTVEMTTSTRRTIEARPYHLFAHEEEGGAGGEPDRDEAASVDGDHDEDAKTGRHSMPEPEPEAGETTRKVVAIEAQREAPGRRPIAGASADGTQEIEIDQLIETREVPGAAAGGTQEIDASSILEEEVLGQAQATTEAESPPGSQGDPDSQVDAALDPRLVRAARGAEWPEAPGRASAEAEAEEDEFDAEPTTPTGDTAASGRQRLQTLELGPDDLEMVEQVAAKLPSLRTPAAASRRGRPAPVEVPQDIKPIPRPRLDSTPEGVPHPRGNPAQALFDDSGRPGGAAPSAKSAAAAPASAGPIRAAASPPASYVTAQPPRPVRRRANTWVMESVDASVAAAARRRALGMWILAAAILLGAIIIAAGAFIAHQRREDAEREQRLQERFERLQQLENDPTE